MSIPRRLGRLARGFVSSGPGEDRLRSQRSEFDEYLRATRGRSEVLKDALGAAWRSAYEEWQRGEEERKAEEARLRDEAARRATSGHGATSSRSSSTGSSASSSRKGYASPFMGRKYSPEVLRAYERLDLVPGVTLSEVDNRRRAMIKKFHPDRFTDPDKRLRAERVTADINSAHDTIERNLLGKR